MKTEVETKQETITSQHISPNVHVRIWRSNTGNPLESFKYKWRHHTFRTVVSVDHTKHGEVEMLGYKERLNDKQITEQINIYEKQRQHIEKTGSVHSEKLDTDQGRFGKALSRIKNFFTFSS